MRPKQGSCFVAACVIALLFQSFGCRCSDERQARLSFVAEFKLSGGKLLKLSNAEGGLDTVEYFLIGSDDSVLTSGVLDDKSLYSGNSVRVIENGELCVVIDRHQVVESIDLDDRESSAERRWARLAVHDPLLCLNLQAISRLDSSEFSGDRNCAFIETLSDDEVASICSGIGGLTITNDRNDWSDMGVLSGLSVVYIRVPANQNLVSSLNLCTKLRNVSVSDISSGKFETEALTRLQTPRMVLMGRAWTEQVAAKLRSPSRLVEITYDDG